MPNSAIDDLYARIMGNDLPAPQQTQPNEFDDWMDERLGLGGAEPDPVYDAEQAAIDSDPEMAAMADDQAGLWRQAEEIDRRAAMRYGGDIDQGVEMYMDARQTQPDIEDEYWAKRTPELVQYADTYMETDTGGRGWDVAGERDQGLAAAKLAAMYLKEEIRPEDMREIDPYVVQQADRIVQEMYPQKRIVTGVGEELYETGREVVAGTEDVVGAVANFFTPKYTGTGKQRRLALSERRQRELDEWRYQQRNAPASMLQEFTRGAARMVPQIAVAAATGGAPVLGTTVMGMQGFDSMEKAALDRGASPEDAMAFAAAASIPYALAEKFQLDHILGAGKAGLSNLLNRGLLGFATDVAVESAVEGGQAAIAELAESAAAQDQDVADSLLAAGEAAYRDFKASLGPMAVLKMFGAGGGQLHQAWQKFAESPSRRNLTGDLQQVADEMGIDTSTKDGRQNLVDAVSDTLQQAQQLAETTPTAEDVAMPQQPAEIAGQELAPVEDAVETQIASEEPGVPQVPEEDLTRSELTGEADKGVVEAIPEPAKPIVEMDEAESADRLTQLEQSVTPAQDLTREVEAELPPAEPLDTLEMKKGAGPEQRRAIVNSAASEIDGMDSRQAIEHLLKRGLFRNKRIAALAKKVLAASQATSKMTLNRGANENNPGQYGSWNKGTGDIALFNLDQMDPDTMAHAILHEHIHTVAADYVMQNPGSDAVKTLQDLASAISRDAEGAGTYVGQVVRDKIADVSKKTAEAREAGASEAELEQIQANAMADIANEMLAEVMSNKDFQTYLEGKKVPGTNKNGFQAFVDFILQTLGIKKGTAAEKGLKAALEVVELSGKQKQAAEAGELAMIEQMSPEEAAAEIRRRGIPDGKTADVFDTAETGEPFKARLYRYEEPGADVRGQWFTNETMADELYADRGEKKAKVVSLQNPLVAEGLTPQSDLIETWAEEGDQEAAKILTDYDGVSDEWMEAADKYISKKLKSMGHDGLIFKGDELQSGTEVLVLDDRAGELAMSQKDPYVELAKARKEMAEELSKPGGGDAHKKINLRTAIDGLLWSIRRLEAQKQDQGELAMVSAMHGSPHRFDKFTTEKMGTGEGAQAFGWGLYFTSRRGVAEHYAKMRALKAPKITIGGKEWKTRDYPKELLDSGHKRNHIQTARLYIAKELGVAPALKVLNEQIAEFEGGIGRGLDALKRRLIGARDILKEFGDKMGLSRENRGNIYNVELWQNRQENLLKWNDRIKGDIKAKILGMIKANRDLFTDDGFRAIVNTLDGDRTNQYVGSARIYTPTGAGIYRALTDALGSDKNASMFLKSNGIDGISFPAASMGRGDGSRGTNYVVFDDADIEVTRREELALAEPAQTTAQRIAALRQKFANNPKILAELDQLEQQFAKFKEKVGPETLERVKRAEEPTVKKAAKPKKKAEPKPRVELVTEKPVVKKGVKGTKRMKAAVEKATGVKKQDTSDKVEMTKKRLQKVLLKAKEIASGEGWKQGQKDLATLKGKLLDLATKELQPTELMQVMAKLARAKNVKQAVSALKVTMRKKVEKATGVKDTSPEVIKTRAQMNKLVFKAQEKAAEAGWKAGEKEGRTTEKMKGKILKTWRDTLIKQARQTIPPQYRHRVISTINKVMTPAAMAKAMEKLDLVAAEAEYKEARKAFKKELAKLKKRYGADAQGMHRELRDKMRALLDGIDTDMGLAKEMKLRKLAEAIDEGLVSKDDMDNLPQKTLEDLDRLDGRTINDLSVAELQDLSDAISTLMARNAYKTKLLNKKSAQEFGAVKEGVVESVVEGGQKGTKLEALMNKVRRGMGMKEIKFEEGEKKGKRAAWLAKQMMRLPTALKAAEKSAGKLYDYVMNDQLRPAKQQAIQNEENLRELVRGEMDKRGLTSERVAKMDQRFGKPNTVQVKLGGRTVSLQESDLIGLALIAEQDSGRGILADGGITVSQTKKGSKGRRGETNIGASTDAEIDGIIEQVRSDKDLSAMMDMWRTLSDKGIYPMVNEVYERLNMHALRQEDNYAPLRRDSAATGTVDQYIGTNVSAYEYNSETIKNMSMTKDRTQDTSSRLRLQNVFDIMSDQIARASAYNAYALPLHNTRKMLKDTQVRDAIDSSAGKGFSDSLIELVGRLGEQRKTDDFMRVYKRLRSATGMGKLFHPVTIFKQGLSVVNATRDVKPQYLIPAVAKYFGKAIPKMVPGMGRLVESAFPDSAKVKEAREQNKWLDNRIDQSYVDADIAGGMNSGNMADMFGVKPNWTKAKELAVGYFGTFDRAAVAAITEAAYNQALAEGKSKKQAADAAAIAVENSQPTFDRIDQTLLMGKNELIKTLLPFRSYLNKAGDQILDSYYSGDMGDFVKTLVVNGGISSALGVITSAAAKALMTGEIPDDEEEWAEFYKKTLSDTKDSSLGIMPFIGNFSRVVSRTRRGEKWGNSVIGQFPLAEAIDKAAGSMGNLIGAGDELYAGDSPEAMKRLKQAAEDGLKAASMAGVPERLINDMRKTWDAWVAEQETKRKKKRKTRKRGRKRRGRR